MTILKRRHSKLTVSYQIDLEIEEVETAPDFSEAAEKFTENDVFGKEVWQRVRDWAETHRKKLPNRQNSKRVAPRHPFSLLNNSTGRFFTMQR